jgi:hypothetical protein
MSPERLRWRARQCFRYAKMATEVEQMKFLLELGRELEQEAEQERITAYVPPLYDSRR